MKVALTAAVISALLIAAAESLSCVQCNSWSETCAAESALECPSAEHNESCVSAAANVSLGDFIGLYQDMSCWDQNCLVELDPFTVHVATGQYFHFASQCCQKESCENATNALASAPGDGSNAVCPACFGLNTTSCSEELHTCGGDQQCVHLVVEFTNHTEILEHLVVKGCSDISNSTCQFLSTENRTIGEMKFLKAECTDALIIPTTKPITTSSASLTACLASWGLGSLLLLGLLL